MQVGGESGSWTTRGDAEDTQPSEAEAMTGDAKSQSWGKLGTGDNRVPSPTPWAGGNAVETAIEYMLRQARDALDATHAAGVRLRVVIAGLEGALEDERSLPAAAPVPSGTP